jgi:hypothetical protein
MGLVATMAALVLGLLIASAKGSYDAQRSELAQLSANIVLLDRILAHYGPETNGIREALRESTTGALQQIWPEQSDQGVQIEPRSANERLYDLILSLSPMTEAQRSLQASALKTAMDVGQTRWLMSAQKSSAIPTPFLVILVFWLALLFASFSVFVRSNATVVITFLFCALSVSAAVYLVMELDHPFEGMIRLSSDPLRRALQQLGR